MNKLIAILCFTGMCLFSVNAQKDIFPNLIGTHQFGVQFIYDGYGTAEITEKDGVLYIKGEQYSDDKEEYLLMEGTITIIDSRNFNFKGRLKLFTEGCCGLLDRQVSYTFRKTGNRKYWRLKERNDLCDQYTCAYYLDIFE
ncbi:hypothetical protein FGM00_03255 [Aggregatimonas sangjinii]|uniref:Uncharacterized protein n=1 Tax=Aggregatimonas sangjinii TaxID=2583587 RepID=A0A5B7SQG2_9FLAO|nr:hypothetical protein [Aggregatimonas sangjinii]QCW99179.1 hypothetical protein FGM00_03255 [Aggregatimonas sangjinii]